MFRATQNAFDDVVLKATDENLTSENWEFIMDVCDKVGATDNGAKEAVAAMIKRLAHRNANVQLYTLELANATSQNCGIKMHRELASRSFTESLLRLAADRNTHQQVKAKILERMSDWAEMFAKDPDLGIMEQAYMRLKTQNPHLQAPSQPPKTLISDSDRRREDEELQMALELSIKEKDSKQNAPAQAQPTSSSQAGAAQVTESVPQPVQPGTTAATVSRVRALYDFNPSEPGELQFRKGDVIAVLESVYKDWWKGSLRGQKGIFPLNYVEKLQDPTADELEREAQMEAEVFAEMKNVEKLLALLSTSSESGRGDVRDNEEITTLYHSTLAIRPKLIELIGKYSQKKDDFTQLNEKFIKARRDYESLLEASMSHPPQPTYGRPAYTYGGAPPQAQQGPYGAGYGNAPPQSQEQRYYSPGPPEQQFPPNNGPQPFYFVASSQAGQAQPQQTQSPPQNSSTDDLYAAPPARTNLAQRPASIAFDPRVASVSAGGPPGGIPHELATGTFDSPVDGRTGYAHPPPAQQTSQPSAPQQQHPSQPYEGYTTAAPNSQRPTSPPQYTQPVIPIQHQQQKPQSAIYTLPSQQAQRLPSGSQQPSDPYGYAAQQPPQQGNQQVPAPQSGPPPQSSTSPIQAQQHQPIQQQTGYPPTTATTGQQLPPAGPTGGYQPYQAYHPTQAAAGAAGAPPGQQRWNAVPPPAGTNTGHAAVPPAGGRGEDEGFYR